MTKNEMRRNEMRRNEKRKNKEITGSHTDGGLGNSRTISVLFASLLLSFALLAPLSAGIKASPATYSIQSSEGDTRYTLTVTNDEPYPVRVSLSASGPLEGYIDFDDSFELEPGASHAVQVTVRVPESLQPGTTENGILLEANSLNPRGGMVGASSAVMHLVRLTTPREGAFLAGELLSSSGVVQEEALITLSLVNTGNEEYTVSPVVFIEGKRIVLEDVLLASGESRNLVVPWTPKAIGQYETSAVVAYAGKQASFSTVITVGELDVDVTRVSYGEFRLGDPFRASLTALNRWGAPIPVDVQVEIVQDGSVLTKSATVRQELEPLKEGIFTMFVESSSLKTGSATANYKLSFADREKSFSQQLIIGIDSISLQGETEKGDNKLVIYALLALAIIAAIFIYLKLVHKRQGE